MITKTDYQIGDLVHISGFNWLYRIERFVFSSDGRYYMCKALFNNVPQNEAIVWAYEETLTLQN